MEAAEFRAGRFFYQTFVKGSGSGWFFNAREGAFGPFGTRLQAQFELESFIQKCIETNVTGGRPSENFDSDRVSDEVEEILAAPPPAHDEPVSSGYFEKMRMAVRERASQYMNSMR